MSSFKLIKGGDLQKKKLAASQTLLPGDLVQVNASGLVELATDADIDIMVCHQKVTSSAAGDPIMVDVDPESIYECEADNGAQALTATTGDLCDIVGASGTFKADLDSSTYDQLQVVAVNTDFDPLQTTTTLSGSALAGDYTVPWASLTKIRVKISRHTFSKRGAA